ncbi:MAG: hypothetical protein ACOCQR_00755 [bacterium]
MNISCQCIHVFAWSKEIENKVSAIKKMFESLQEKQEKIARKIVKKIVFIVSIFKLLIKQFRR